VGVKKSELEGFSEPNPRKGTETMEFNTEMGIGQLPIQCFSEPNPRKGTETWMLRVTVYFPVSCFSEPNPRKGTETTTETR